MDVTHWMTKNPVVAQSNESLATVRRKMDKGNFHRVPVVDGGKLVGSSATATCASTSDRGRESQRRHDQAGG